VLDIARSVTGGRGISAAVILPGETLWAGTSGQSHAGVPIDGQMLFDVASVGKTLVAALILQLTEEGRLSLDDRVGGWLPPIPEVDPSITVRQLLGHTSGLFDFVEHESSPFRVPFEAIDFAEVSSPERVVFDLAGKPYFRPGQGWHYSTTNYLLLRMIAERVTGAPVAQEVRRRFLEPLRHTVVLDSAAPVPASFQVAHPWWDADGDGRPDDISDRPTAWMATRSPAMVYMSAADLARWGRALHDGTVLGTESLHELTAFRRPAPGEPYSGFGLGTGEFRLGGTSLWGHLGWQYGYTTAMFYAPGSGASIAVLVNDNNMAAIHAAAIGLWVLTEVQQQKARSVVLALAAALFCSPIVLLPIAAALSRHRRPQTSARPPSMPPLAGLVAVVAPFAFVAAAVAYIAYGVSPEGPLAWTGATPLARSVVSLGLLCLALSVVMAVLAAVAWIRRQGAPRWRLYYTLVAMAALVLLHQLTAWGLPLG